MSDPKTTPEAEAGSTQEQLASLLTQIADLAAANGMNAVADELRNERLPALRERRMTMVVLGEFNHGKSTVINALLGRELVPTGITPTTSVITHIEHGGGDARLVCESGVNEVSADKLKLTLTDDPPADLRYVEVPVESELLADGLVIVDTPGVNDISQQKAEITYGYVPRADVVVYVFDASQAMKRSEVTFIRDRLLKNSLERVFFVIGKVDTLSRLELNEVEGHVRSKLQELIGDVPLFSVSARRAIESSDEGFEAFRNAVTDYVSTQRDEIIVDSALRSGLRLGSILDHGLAIEWGAAMLKEEELEAKVATIHSRLSQSRIMVDDNVALIDAKAAEIAAATRANIRSFVSEFAAALPQEISRASASDIKRYLPDFIHDTFKTWLEREGTHVAFQLEHLAEEIISITNQNMQDALDLVESELGGRTRNLNFDVDTFGYDVGVFAVGALGVAFMAFSQVVVGSALAIAAPVLAFALKGKVDDAIRERAIDQAQTAVKTAGAKVETQFDELIDDFAGRLKAFVEGAGHRLYRQIADALDRVVAQRSETKAGNEEIRDGVESARKELAVHLQALKTLSESL